MNDDDDDRLLTAVLSWFPYFYAENAILASFTNQLNILRHGL